MIQFDLCIFLTFCVVQPPPIKKLPSGELSKWYRRSIGMMVSHFLGILAVLCGKTNAYVPQTFTTVCIFWWFQLCVISTPSSWEIRIPCWLAHIYQMGGETTMEHFCLMRTSNHIIREWLDMIGLSNRFLSIAFSFHAPIFRRWLDPKRGWFFDKMGAITKNFR